MEIVLKEAVDHPPSPLEAIDHPPSPLESLDDTRTPRVNKPKKQRVIQKGDYILMPSRKQSHNVHMLHLVAIQYEINAY